MLFIEVVMNSQDRIENIINEMKKQNFSTEKKANKKIDFKGESKLYDAYRIELSDLIYNVNNGRIMSLVESEESFGNPVDPETPEGKKKIEDFLWRSNEKRNEKTLEDIADNQQREIGIITRDGIIIDGNRRAMLLNMLKKERFLCAVLDVTYEEDPKEIQRLETQYQIGEDGKVDYPAIEKYLKTARHIANGDSPEKIAELMNVDEEEIKKNLKIKETMDQYLEYFEYGKAMVRLEKREDAFIAVTNWVDKFTNNPQSLDAFQGFRQTDVIDLKTICFHYIRAIYQITGQMTWQDFRKVARGRRENQFFGDEEIWRTFAQEHFNVIEKMLDEEEDIRDVLDSPNVEKALESRDQKFADKSIDHLYENFNNGLRKLERNQNINEPKKNIREGFDDIKSALDKSKKLLTSEDEDKLNELATMILNSHDDSLLRQLKQLSSLSKNINLENIDEAQEDKNKIRNEVESLKKFIFDLSKRVK